MVHIISASDEILEDSSAFGERVQRWRSYIAIVWRCRTEWSDWSAYIRVWWWYRPGVGGEQSGRRHWS